VSIANAIGAGLAIAGALAALAVFVWRLDGSDRTTIYAYERTVRRVQSATIFSVVATVAGAALLLVSSEWRWAVGAFIAVVAIFYLVQVVSAHRHWRALREQLDREMSSDLVQLTTLAEIGTFHADFETFDALVRTPYLGKALVDDPQVAYAHDVVVERSTVGWALQHPLGGTPPPSFGDAAAEYGDDVDDDDEDEVG
jgi:hypothetical protein